ncbi:MAG: hypothetical protein OD814_001549, partial [Candidatus Alkanophagales archaeon MCA70_species_1]|nr:hypothetical protein [Candidatus Alkanophaga volatiphilum]
QVAANMWYLNVTNLAYDTYTYQAIAQDAAGNIGTSETRTVTIKPPAPSVEIWTDKQTYHPSDTMNVGLNVTNPGPPFSCRFAIWLEMQPYSSNVVIVDTYVTLPANLDYSNPAFLRFKLPYILPGTYVWHAAIIDPTTGEIVSHDDAEWQFSW